MAVYNNSITLASVSDGQSGAPGDDGIGIENIQEQYYAAATDSPLVNPDSLNWQTSYTWDSTKPYLWTRSEITWTAPNPTNPTHTTPVLASGINSANATASGASSAAAGAVSTANQTATNLSNYQTTTDLKLQDLQNQIDKSIETWYYSGVPGSNVAPENAWVPISGQQEDTRSEHVGDLYYDQTTGYAYRYLYDETASPQYSWVLIRDEAVTEALALAGSKSKIWISQPAPPYKSGDLWVVIDQQGKATTYYCKRDRETGSFNSADWEVSATDDTAAAAALAAAQGAQSTADTITQNAITKVDVYYAKNASPTDAPSGYDNPAASANWDTNPPTWENRKYIWSVTVTTKNGANTVTDPVCITGAKGETGAPAPYITLTGPTNVITVDVNNGNAVSPATIAVVGTPTNTTINSWQYSVNGGSYGSTAAGVSISGNTVTITSADMPSSTKTITIKAANTSAGVSDTYTVTRLVNGQNGTKGDDGTSSYTYIRYADDDQGTNINPTVLSTSKYVAIQITNSSTAPSSGWVWQKFVGDDGDDATQYYTHVRYSANANGSNYVETPTDATKYVGICVTLSKTPPAYNSSDWKWSKYVGDNGKDAVQYYTHIMYATSASGANISSNPSGKTYIGIRVDEVETATTDPDQYTWSKFIGTNGTDGFSLWTTTAAPSNNVYTRNQLTGPSVSQTPRVGEVIIRSNRYQYTITAVSGNNITVGSAVDLKGAKGEDGTSIIWKGELSSAPSNPQTLWAYYNTTNKETYIYNGSSWETMAVSGEDGEQYYYHVVYCNNTSTGDGYSVSPNGQLYTGTYTDTTSADATTWSAVQSKNVKWNYTKGATGAKGADAIEVILSNESHTLTANAAGAVSSYTNAYTNVQIFEGIVDKSANYSIKVNNVASGSTTINGITVTVSNSSNPVERKVTVTAVSSGFTNNVVPIDIYNSSGTKVATKNFTISVSKAGAGISTVTISYGYSTSGTDASTVPASRTTSNPGGWDATIPSVPQGQYLWTRTVTTFTGGAASKTTYSVSRAGKDGIDGDLYRVDTNYQEVYRTYSVDTSTGEEIVNYSPSILTFRAYKEDTLQTCNTNYKYDVSILYDKDGYSTDINVDYIYSFLTGLVVPSGSSFPFTLSNNNQVINFNIRDFMALTSNNSNDKTRIEEIQNLVRTANIFFVITILDPSSTVGTTNTYKIFTKHIFSVTNSVTSSLASFSTTANSINAAVREAKMQFTTDGLEITNGSFSIKDKDGQEVLSYRTGAENLYVKGRIEADDGYFHGELKAATGNFAGDISAAKGTFKGNIDVGGDSVFRGKLEAASGTFRGELVAAEGSFKGAITAREGEIGGFKIGETALYANVPSGATTATSHLVLDSAIPSIKLGSLSFDGSTSTIQGNSFTITSDTAWFNNIALSGKITASVFEIGKTQAVGGAMIFKPSYKVESFTSNSLTLDVAPTSLTITQHVLVIDKEGNEISDTSIKSISGKTVNFNNNPFSGEEPNTLIILGTDTDIIIGIDSTPNGSSFLMGEGLTIRTYNKQKPNLFLGNLGNSKNAGIIGNNVSGYGLYADNVVLNGSLTTIVNNASTNNPTYAGVNTLSPVQANKFNNDSSNVVFWAGSAGVAAEQIANAPFQVTEKGSLYAAQGKFEGAIITRSEIQGVDIYGARIHGTGKDIGEDYGLALYNTTNGIIFYRGDYRVPENELYYEKNGSNQYVLTQDKIFQVGKIYYKKDKNNNYVEVVTSETFSIGSEGLKFGDHYFIEINGTENVDFSGDEFIGNTFTASNFLQGKTLVAKDNTGTNTITGTRIVNNNKSYIEFSNTMNFNIKESATSQLQLEETRGIFNVNDLIAKINLQIGKNLQIGDANSSMRFTQVDKGYDLYIA